MCFCIIFLLVLQNFRNYQDFDINHKVLVDLLQIYFCFSVHVIDVCISSKGSFIIFITLLIECFH